MAKWTVTYEEVQHGGCQILKDDLGYQGLTLDFLPSDVLAVQSPDGVTAEIEYGNRATMTNERNEEVATSELSWWSNVEAAWQAEHDAALAAIAVQAAAGAETEAAAG